MKSAKMYLAICGALFCAVAGLGQEKLPPKAAGELAQAPASTHSLRNPFAGQPSAVQAGQKLYRRYCAECHGEDGRGQGKAPDLHAPLIQDLPPGVLFWFLKNGNLREGMPSWSRLPEPQRWQLVTYLKTFQDSRPAHEERATP